MIDISKDKNKNGSCLILFSGGQDSTTALFWALENFNNVYAISFFYGQKHSIEISIAKDICKKLDIKQKIVDISFLEDLVVSGLFESSDKNVADTHPLNPLLPSSFVPYRNLIFLSLAASYATVINTNNIVIGVSEADYSGYPDCRKEFIESLERTLRLAIDLDNINIITPLISLTKSDIFMLASRLNCLDFIINETMTCYNGSKIKNDFGFGCGKCPACLLRKKGYEEFLSIVKNLCN